MGSTTATYKLRYPAGSDPANIQQDMANLAADVDAFVASIPVGASMEWDYGSAQIPVWMLLQYGQAVSRSSYPRLHALALAATYPHGNGDGSSTFNIADKRGRVSAGKDDMGGTAASRITAAISGTAGTVLGAAVGAEGVALSTASMPSHSHGGATGVMSNDHTHSADSWGRNAAHNHADPGHNHVPAVGGLGSEGWLGVGSGWYSGSNGAPFGPHYGGNWYASNTGNMSSGTESADHAHGTNTGGIDTNHVHAIPADGGGGAHLNTQPTIIAHKVVRAL